MFTYKIFLRKHTRYYNPNRVVAHDLCEDDCPSDAPYGAKRFWKKNNLGECDGVVIAYRKKKIVGFFRFDKSRYTLWGAGTFVMLKYRKDGIAKKMWARAIKKVKPKRIDAYVVSKGGRRLVESMRKKFPKIKWIITS